MALVGRWRRAVALLRFEDEQYGEVDVPTLTEGKIVRKITGLLTPHWRRLVVVGICTLLIAATEMAAPLLSRALFDDALFPVGGPNLSVLLLVLGLMIAAMVLGMALQLVNTYFNYSIGQRVVHNLRERLYEQITRQSLRFFASSRTGELQTRVLGDVGGVQHTLTEVWPALLLNSVTLVAAATVMLLLAWPLALVSLLVLSPALLIVRFTARFRRRIASLTRRSAIEMNVIAEETLSISGALLTKAFGREHTQLERFSRESDRMSRLVVRSELLGRTLGLGLQSFYRIGPFSVYLVAGLVMAYGGFAITPGTIVAFLALQARMSAALQSLGEIAIQFTATTVYFERIFSCLDMEPDIRDRPGAVTLAPESVRGAVRLRDVSFTYPLDGPTAALAAETPGRHWALQDVSLEVEPGQTAAIVGPSGAGKTTLSYLVARLYDADRGAIEIDGHDVRDLRLQSLASLIGLVTQETYILHATLRENLLYASPDATGEEIEAAARAALLHDRVMELPSGYDTLVGARGYRLSGGERQRLALARVLLKDPPLLILDEATSSLDTRSERLIQQALGSLETGRTTIVIAHRLSTIVAADVIFVLDNGRLVERGTHSELLARGGLYAELHQHNFAGGAVEARCADGVVFTEALADAGA